MGTDVSTSTWCPTQPCSSSIINSTAAMLRRSLTMTKRRRRRERERRLVTMQPNLQSRQL